VPYYTLCVAAGFVLGTLVIRQRWKAAGGDPRLVEELAIYVLPAATIGGRLYHDVTSWEEVPHTAFGWLEVWNGGTGVWGVVGGGAAAVVYVVHRRGADVARFLDAAVPGLLVGHVLGRLGNYFNQEIVGRPSDRPWALEIDPSHRPARYISHATFHPVFLYEMAWNAALALALLWLARRRRIRPAGLFALYVGGYCAFRVFEETLRVDPSHHLLGLRLNLYVAAFGLLAGATWFAHAQRAPE
jgi:prolipoprotein diacylglyceryl transferase